MNTMISKKLSKCTVTASQNVYFLFRHNFFGYPYFLTVVNNHNLLHYQYKL